MKTLTQDQIDAVIDWMNNWEQLENTAIPIRFKEDWIKQLNLDVVNQSKFEPQKNIDMKTLLIIDTEADRVDYRIVENDDTITLYRSNSEHWSPDCQGEELLSVTDDGNGVKWSKSIKKMDYSELNHFMILCKYIDNRQPFPQTYILAEQ